VPGSVVFVSVPFLRVAVHDHLFSRPGALLWMSVPLLIMLGIVLSIPAVVRRLEMARYRRARDVRSPETRVLAEEGFTSGEEGSRPIPWPMITQVVESEHYYFFYHALSDVPEYLPKRALTESDATKLRALLHDLFSARSPDLQLRAPAT